MVLHTYSSPGLLTFQAKHDSVIHVHLDYHTMSQICQQPHRQLCLLRHYNSYIKTSIDAQMTNVIIIIINQCGVMN